MTHPHQKHRAALASLIRDVSRTEGHTEHEVFRLFLEASYRAIRGAIMLGSAWQSNEEEYMKLVSSFRKPADSMRLIAEMLAVTTEALEVSCEDFLGPAYIEIGGSKAQGQFFTPHALSKTNAMLLMPDIAGMIERSSRGYFTAHEPAAGMGGMVLAVAELMREQGLDPARHCHWQMVDVEFKAMAGCYIQTSLAAVSGVVIHGNTLSLETWASSSTPMAVLFPKQFTETAMPPVVDAHEDPAQPFLPPAAPIETPQMAFSF